MGWASGSSLMNDVIQAIRGHVPPGPRREIYGKLIDSFEDMDWDTQSECLGHDPVFDAALADRHPDWEIEVPAEPEPQPLFVRGTHYEPGPWSPDKSVEYRLGYYVHKPGAEAPFLGIRFAKETEFRGTRVPEGHVLRLSEVVDGNTVEPIGVAVPAKGDEVVSADPIPPPPVRRPPSPEMEARLAEFREAEPAFEASLSDGWFDLPSEIAEGMLRLSVEQLSSIWNSVPEEVLQQFNYRPPPPKSKEERLAEVQAAKERRERRAQLMAEASELLESLCTVKDTNGDDVPLAGFIWEAISEPETDPMFDTYVSRIVTALQEACKDVVELDEAAPVFRDLDSANAILKQLVKDLDAAG